MQYNVEAFKQLIKKYKSISEQDIDETYNDIKSNNDIKFNKYIAFNKYRFGITFRNVLKELTNFGTDRCLLCKEASLIYEHKYTNVILTKCHVCLYKFNTTNNFCYDSDTYKAFNQYYTNSEDMLRLIAERVEFMEYILRQYEEQQLKDM